MKYYILANYMTNESFEIESELVNKGFDWGQPLIKVQKSLLKQFGKQQKGHNVIVVNQAGCDLIKRKFPETHIEAVE